MKSSLLPVLALFSIILACTPKAEQPTGNKNNQRQYYPLLQLLTGEFSNAKLTDSILQFNDPMDSSDYFVWIDTVMNLPNGQQLAIINKSMFKEPCPHVGSVGLLALYSKSDSGPMLLNMTTEPVLFAPWCDMPDMKLITQDSTTLLLTEISDGNNGFNHRVISVVHLDSANLGAVALSTELYDLAYHNFGSVTGKNGQEDTELIQYYESSITVILGTDPIYDHDITLLNSFTVTWGDGWPNQKSDGIQATGVDEYHYNYANGSYQLVKSVINSPYWAGMVEKSPEQDMSKAD